MSLKKIVYFVFVISALPLVLIFHCLKIFSNRDGLVSGFSQFLSLFPGICGVYFRKAALRYMIKYCHSECHISFGVLMSQFDTEIDSGAYIGPQSNIGKCKIGKNTLIGSGVHIMSGKSQHNFDDLNTPIKDQGGIFEKVSIGDDCWIGNGALIMASVGDKSVVAAGSVVIDSVPACVIVAGNPAKIIKVRS